MPGTIRTPSELAFPPARSPAPAIESPPPARSSSAGGASSNGGGLRDSPTNLAIPASAPAEAQPKVCPTCGLRYPAEFKVCPRDAVELIEAADAGRDPLLGVTLGQTYTLVRVLGEGGMGRVYEARHTRIGSKRFAVKILHPEFARQPEVISRFQREAEAAASIRSEYVVGVYDVDRFEDGRPYLVGEFLEGQEFADYLNAVGKMGVAPAVRLVRQICSALAAAHEKGVVHRDMKPENVFLTGDLARPTAKVIDFGISKLGDSPGTALTKTGMIMGTPSYMAPEQARGERVDHRADIYAVGAILYCALTGQRPFDRGDPTATLTAVLTQDPPRPRSLEPSIPEPLEMIIQRAMAKDPNDRPQSMEELSAALRPYDVDAPEAISLPPPEFGAGSGASMTTGAGRGVRSAALERQAREAAMARPLIVLLSGLGVFWIVASAITSITAMVRIARGGGATANLTGSEAAFLVLGATFTLVTPVVVAVRHVAKTVWDNSVKALDLAERLRRPVIVAMCAYGFGSLLIRTIEAVLLRRAAGAAWPVWDLVLLVIGVSAAAGAYALFSAERRRG
jgi:hypothetical protein